MSDTFVELFCIVERETDMALLLDFGLKDSVWVPKSVINGSPDYERGVGIDLEIEEWFATNKDLI